MREVKAELKQSAIAHAVISAYFITVFLMCVAVISILTAVFGLQGNLVAMSAVGVVVFVVLGAADILLVRTKHWSLALILWIIPLLLVCLGIALFKKQKTVEYEISAPKDIAYSALTLNQTRHVEC